MFDVEGRINRVLTQYRESPHLLAMLRAYIDQVRQAAVSADEMLDFFDIDTAVGDQLTILGKALGWPRTHCAGQRRPVFGFECEDDCGIPLQPIGGFCEAEWDCDGAPDYVEFTFTDDELYRRFLKARIVTLTGDFTRSGITAAARVAFGDLAVIYVDEPGTVGIATGRLLSNIEISIVHLYRQVMPVAPGIELEIWHGDGPPFGFGAGWGGFCDGSFHIEVTDNG